MIGFSSAFGTGTFLAPGLSNLLGSGILIVPVPLSLNVPGFGLATPFGSPNVFPFPLCVWLLPCGTDTPAKFDYPGFEVVPRQKVLAVGALRGSCLD